MLGDRGGEGDDVVADFGFDLVDAGDGEVAFLGDGVGGGLGDKAGVGEGLRCGGLDAEPATVLVLVGPDAAELRAGVARDHRYKLKGKSALTPGGRYFVPFWASRGRTARSSVATNGISTRSSRDSRSKRPRAERARTVGLLLYAEEFRHLFMQEAVAWAVGLDPFAVEHELRNGFFAHVFVHGFGGAGYLLNVDLGVGDVVLREETLGFTTITAPGSGIHGQFHRSSLLDGGFGIQQRVRGEHDATDTQCTGAGTA